jgi:hypothetical protein
MGAAGLYNLPYLVTAMLLVGMPIAMEIGRRVRLAHGHAEFAAAEAGTGPLDAAVYALFGLLLAFIFSGAAGRFDERRDLIAHETNAIGTAYLRLDLLPEANQARLRPLFREYVESRLETYRAMRDPEAAWAEHLRDLELQQQIWTLATAAARETGNPSVMSLVVTALNEMIDVTTLRLAATRKHPPMIVFAMLVVVALAASFLSGMAMAKSPARPWPHILAFTLVISATAYVILDMELPRQGFIRVDGADALLEELLDDMQAADPAPVRDS